MKDNFKDDTFLARWLNGELSEQELAEFESSEEFETYQKIAETTGDFQTPSWNKQSGWEKLSEAANFSGTEQKTTKVRQLNSWWKYAVAASLILIAGYFTLFQGDSRQIYKTTIAQQETIKLPDGSTVYLNAGSELSYDAENFVDERVLNLEGEAFFEVQKGESFTVHTENGDVKVLGTSFNVLSRKNKIDVACYTGKVGLSFDRFKQAAILNPGDQAIAIDRRIALKPQFDIQSALPAWKNGESKFVQVNFIEVIEELERQYDIEITYPKELLEINDFSGGFPHGNLNSALDIIFTKVNYKYEKKGKKIDVLK